MLVATIRALKYNGGVPRAELGNENVEALKKGVVNLQKHIENMHQFGVPVVVALNRFATDTDAEIQYIHDFCTEMGVSYAFADVFAKGGDGGIELAKIVCDTIADPKNSNLAFHPLYDEKLPIKEKLACIAKNIYGADDVVYTTQAEKDLKEIEALGADKLPICVAKTQYSLSDNPELLGRPEHFTITVRNLKLSAGAGFVVALTGSIMTMPGLPKAPAALRIDIDRTGTITGLF